MGADVIMGRSMESQHQLHQALLPLPVTGILLQMPASWFTGSQRTPVQSRAPCWPAVDMPSECELLRVCYCGIAQPILTVTLTPTGSGFTASPLEPRDTTTQWAQVVRTALYWVCFVLCCVFSVQHRADT